MTEYTPRTPIIVTSAIAVVSFLLLTVCSCSYQAGIDEVRIKAVEHGFATWQVDAEGSTTFTWNETEQPE